MEEKRTGNMVDPAADAGTSAEQQPAGTGDAASAENGAAAPGTPAEEGAKKPRRRGLLWIVLLLCAACAAGYGYYYNLPAQKLERAMQAADELLEQARFKEAADKYLDAIEIDPDNAAAREGFVDSLTGEADSLAAQEDIPVRAQAFELYREIIRQCEDMPADARGEKTQALQEETARKLEALEKEVAGAYETIETSTDMDDRSGRIVQPDGTEKKYTWYYDLVRISDPYYPYAEAINTVLEQERDSFFARTESFPSDAAEAGTGEDESRDYVGVAGVYSGEGLLCIRMAEVRAQGNSRANYYRGVTFRLSDAGVVTLSDLTGRTDSGVRRLVKRRLRDWLDQEGWQNISRSLIEKYVEDTPPDEFKYCIRDDGKLCLVVDQEAPFFTAGTEILEIPLED